MMGETASLVKIELSLFHNQICMRSEYMMWMFEKLGRVAGALKPNSSSIINYLKKTFF